MPKTPAYQPRHYRDWSRDTDLVSFTVAVKETDLYIRSDRRLHAKALKSVIKHRASLEEYIARDPVFLSSLTPHTVPDGSPRIVKEMARAASAVGVGPMAAVAGAVAEEVARDLLPYCKEVIIENGGDIFMVVARPRRVAVYAGDSPFTGKIALEIQPEDTPLGVATSSGTVGHSLSFGLADAAIVLAPTGYLSDAAATALGNRVTTAEDIPQALEWAQGIPGLTGVAVIKGDRIGAWGRIRLTAL